MDYNIDDFYNFIIDLSKKGKFKRILDEIGSSNKLNIIKESALENLYMMKKIVDSMTSEEKRNPQSLTKMQREEIADRCDVKISEIDQIINIFNNNYQFLSLNKESLEVNVEKMEKNYNKLISLMEEIKVDDLILERKYLPEFIDDSLILVQNTSDGFPVLKSRFKFFLNKKGIFVEYKNFLIYFLKKSNLDNQEDSLEYKIENVVVTLWGEVEKEIDLNHIAQKTIDVEYNPDRIPGIIYRIQDPKATFIIFPEGRILITGLRDVRDINPVVDNILEIIKIMGIKISNVKITSQNIIANGNLNFKIDLNTAILELENSKFEPEIFPGLIYRMQDLNVMFLIFSTGYFICTNAEDKENINTAILILKEKMIKFRI